MIIILGWPKLHDIAINEAETPLMKIVVAILRFTAKHWNVKFISYAADSQLKIGPPGWPYARQRPHALDDYFKKNIAFQKPLTKKT